MKKKIFYAAIFVSILISSSVVIATPEQTPPGKSEENDAPGQWKKSDESAFANQQEFVFAVHMRIWERIQACYEKYFALGIEKSVPNPIGLLKLLNQIILESELEDDEEELEPEEALEPEEEIEPEEEEEFEPEEEPEIEDEEEFEIEEESEVEE